MTLRSPVLALAVLAAAACRASSAPATPSPDAPPLLGQDCDPLVPTACALPFPSNVWTVPDPSQPTGMHLHFGPTTLPRYQGAHHIDPSAWLDRDGFSPGSVLMAHLPGATAAGLPDADHIDRSLDPDSPTVLLEADTGARVAHFAELDTQPTTPDAERALLIHPAARLKSATRYLVAVRRLVDAGGTPLAPSPVFAALRDGTPSDDPSVGLRRDLYADILGRLRAAGVDPSDLQLAWDFTTSSDENTTSRLLHARDDALARVGADGPPYTIDQIVDDPNPHIRRRITGTMTVPLYLDRPGPGASLHLGADGLPAANGTAAFPFLVQIPVSVVASGKPAPILQYGHGLLGSRAEGEDDFVAATCDREGYVEVAVDLVGMASDDLNYVIDVMSGDIGRFSHVVDRMHQGFVNELLAMRMMMGAMARDARTMPAGAPTIDPTARFYRGDSQGGISGGVYMAVSPDVTRGVLGEAGAPYDLLLDRSVDFGPYFLLLHGIYPSAVDIQLAIDLIQQLWDRSEPDGYLARLAGGAPGAGGGAHQVLLQVAIGDHQVTPLGAHYVARSIGARTLSPAPRPIWGVTAAPSGFEGSGIVEWDFGLPPAPAADVPDTMGNDPHPVLPTLTDAQDMADVFLRTGRVVQVCGGGAGPCRAPAGW